MKAIWTPTGFAAVLLAFGWMSPRPAASQPLRADSPVENQIVLRVNDHIATLYDYQRELAEQTRLLNSAPDLDNAERERIRADLPQTVMGEMFNRLLVMSRARQLGVTTTQFEFDQYLDQLRRENGLEDPQALEAALAREGLTLEDLNQRFTVEQSRMGIVQQEVRPRVDVTEEEVRRIYDERIEDFRVPERVKVREIVVLDSPQAQDLAETVVAELRSGATFEEVKERHGDQLSGVLDIGWVSRGDLDPAIEDAVWELDEEQIADPVSARGGLHLAQLVEREDASVRPYEEVQEQVYRAEFNRQMLEEYEEYLLELQDKAFFQCRGPAEDFCQQKLAGTLATTDSFDGTFGLDDVDRLFAPNADTPAEKDSDDGESEGQSDGPDGQ